MAIVAGVDFGTLSVRVSIFDSRTGRLGSGTGDYPLHRKKEDPDYATQSHADHMVALGQRYRARRLKPPECHGEDGRGDRDRYHRVERDSGRCQAAAARRLLLVVRPPRLA